MPSITNYGGVNMGDRVTWSLTTIIVKDKLISETLSE